MTETILPNEYSYTSSLVKASDIKEVKTYRVQPRNTNLLNSNGNVTTIKKDSFDQISLFYKAEIVLTLSFWRTSTRAASLAPDDTVAPINNFVYTLFDSIDLSINNTKIESLQNIYYPLTMLKMVTRSNDYLQTEGVFDSNILDSNFNNTAVAANSGWSNRNYRYVSNAKVDGNKRHSQVTIELKDIFGFCNTYKKPLYNCTVQLDFKRIINDLNSFFNRGNVANQAANPPVAAVMDYGFIDIDTMELRIPQIILESAKQAAYELQFQDNLEANITFNKRIFDVQTLSGTNIQSIQLRTINNPPEYMLMAIMEDNIINNPSRFTNNGLFSDFLPNIERIVLKLGNTQVYPATGFEPYDQFDFSEQLYKEYINLSYKFNKAPQLTPFQFRNNYPFVCFDLSKHKENIYVAGNSIKLEFKMSATNQTNYRLFIVYVENCLFKSKLTPLGITNLQETSFNAIGN